MFHFWFIDKSKEIKQGQTFGSKKHLQAFSSNILIKMNKKEKLENAQ